MSEMMDPTPHQDAPDERELESWLSHFRPNPSRRFYQRMQAAPWQPAAGVKGPLVTNRRPSLRLIWAVAALSLILLVGVITLVPPVRAIARQIIFSFVSSPSSQIEVQVTLSSPGDLFNYSDPTNFSLTVEQAQTLAGFQVKQISALPKDLDLVGARFDADYNSVTLFYQADGYVLFLTQHPLGNSQDVFSIGQGATVKLVKIGDVQGEFVQGGWKAVSTQATGELQTPEKPVNITAIWDTSLPQSTLRWQVGGSAYELRSLGESGPSQSQLIKWANELK